MSRSSILVKSNLVSDKHVSIYLDFHCHKMKNGTSNVSLQTTQRAS